MIRRAMPIALATVLLAVSARAEDIASPDGKIVASFRLDEAGVPRYAVRLGDQVVLQEAPLGIVRDDADLSVNLKLVEASPQTVVRDEYELLTSKRRRNAYAANRRVFGLVAAGGQRIDVVFQVSNDGVAFRYEFPGTGDAVRRVTAERTTFRFPTGTRAWIQPMSTAKTGWSRTNPSYEEHYLQDVPVGTPSPLKAGWVYPALFRSGETWLLVSEAAPTRGYCLTRLVNGDDAESYRIGFPDAREGLPNRPVNPESKLPSRTPWRLVVIGSLKTVVESSLGTDLAEPPAKPVDVSALPGKASWSWPLLQDGQTIESTQKRFIDYAADMGWQYCLVDALWDIQIGYDGMKRLCDHAKARNVKVLVWYNSNGNWNDAHQSPRDRLLTKISRTEEFDRLKAMGVAGMKIDFFGGDGQSMLNYQLDLLEAAAPYGFSINFHGTTLPRGLQRTYPHFMTAEAIRGQEFITFGQGDADKQPTHVAMLPFTRNVFDPMDFTPLVLDRMKGRERRTTSAFELASSVLMVSGIQHYAELPEVIAKVPPYLKQFLKDVPSIWDDTRFIGGFPGKDVVVARLASDKWWIAGVNGEAKEKTLTLDLADLPCAAKGQLITDGDGGNMTFAERPAELDAGRKLTVTLQPNGGFVATFDARR